MRPTTQQLHDSWKVLSDFRLDRPHLPVHVWSAIGKTMRALDLEIERREEEAIRQQEEQSELEES